MNRSISEAEAKLIHRALSANLKELKLFAKHESVYVRASVLANQKIDKETRNLLRNDPDERVRNLASMSQDALYAAIWKMTVDLAYSPPTHSGTHSMHFLGRPRAPPEPLYYGLWDNGIRALEDG